MKYMKRCLLFASITVLAGIGKFDRPSPVYGTARAPGGGEVVKEGFYPPIAETAHIEEIDVSEEELSLPKRFDLREENRAGIVKNQMDTETCWAFASLSALESALLPEEAAEFSPNHMSRNNSFAMNADAGGEYTMALAYLLSWKGPVYEKDDPPAENQTAEGLIAAKHVQEVQMIESRDFEGIKEAVFRYGGVETAFYSAFGNSHEKLDFYNELTYAYCYNGTKKPNHEVVVIGWDDDYPKENFSAEVEGDGAFICQNSWGGEFGEGGIFYVSYYDANIGSYNIAYTKVEETDNYDKIYQSDLCGWVGQIGFKKPDVYGANIFTAEGAEELSAVGFYASGKNTRYRIYVVKNFEGKTSFENKILAAEGKLKHAGYYTMPVEQEMEENQKEAFAFKQNERFGVVVYLNTPEAVHPMAIEYAADEETKDAVVSDGEGYISSDGTKWERVEDIFSCNLCIKAYTKNR